MNVKIQSLKFDADRKLIDFIESKLDKVEKFSNDIIAADVILRIEKDNEHGNKVAVVSFDVVGDKLVAEKQCKTFEESVDLCLEALKKQLSKHKETK